MFIKDLDLKETKLYKVVDIHSKGFISLFLIITVYFTHFFSLVDLKESPIDEMIYSLSCLNLLTLCFVGSKNRRYMDIPVRLEFSSGLFGPIVEISNKNCLFYYIDQNSLVVRGPIS